MPFIPHTPEDVSTMLSAIGAASIEDLFDEIPSALKTGKLKDVPDGLPEMAVTRLMQERASQDGFWSNFIGAGVYEHHIPAAIWQITTRGEFYSAYTPYQAEASQGTLQLIYEYQTMMTRLTGLDVSNASLYDGASALAEAVLMAVRAHKSSKRVLLPLSVHPVWRRMVKTIVRNQGVELVDVPYCAEAGHTLPDALAKFKGQDIAALVVPQPNFFGVLEPVGELTDWAHANNALLIAAVNPMALAILKPPGA
ncbi:MAG: glycine dehydrogenase, partial [Thiobacillus sp.]|nr:glycine dehydrogenase [Thiobacillus sp.]